MHFLLMHVQKSVGKYKMDTQQLPPPPQKKHRTKQVEMEKKMANVNILMCVCV